jgi:threonyl-tRNA synthetase
MLIVGDKEMENGSVAVRQRGKGDIGAIPAGEFMDIIVSEITAKA